jgi:hypothetical protein
MRSYSVPAGHREQQKAGALPRKGDALAVAMGEIGKINIQSKERKSSSEGRALVFFENDASQGHGQSNVQSHGDSDSQGKSHRTSTSDMGAAQTFQPVTQPIARADGEDSRLVPRDEADPPGRKK